MVNLIVSVGCLAHRMIVYALSNTYLNILLYCLIVCPIFRPKTEAYAGMKQTRHSDKAV